jgi:DNA replication protein DnaC
MTTTDLTDRLTKLGFHYLASNVMEFCARATKNKLSPYQMVEQLGHLEQEEKLRRGLIRRLNGASLGRYKPLSEFDWAWPKKINRDAIDDLLTVKFVDEPANVVIFGPSGAGKTMIAKNIAYAAVSAGHTALFTSASEMLGDLERQESPRLLKFRLQRYAKPKVLIIDEVGYLSYSTRAADLMFQLVNARHEVSTIITTNLAFKDWSSTSPGSACLVAMLDRLTHRAEIIAIEADSWRNKEASERKTSKAKKREVKHDGLK